MRALSRRTLFALPLAVPAAGLAAALPAVRPKVRTYEEAFPLARSRVFELVRKHGMKTANEMLRTERLSKVGGHWHVLWRNPSPLDLARTLGIPYDEPPAFTDADVAATLGIDGGGLDDRIAVVAVETERGSCTDGNKFTTEVSDVHQDQD